MSQFFIWEYADLPSEQQVREALLPHFDKFNLAFSRAWDEWLGEVRVETRMKIGPMQRDGVIHELTKSHADDLFSPAVPGNQGIEICRALNIFKLYIDGSLVVRFRKLNSDRSVSLLCASDRTKNYYKNEPVNGIRPNYSRLTAGYILDEFDESIEDIAITCQVQDEVIFSFSIVDESHCVDSFHQPSEIPPSPIVSPVSQPSSSEDTA